MATEQIAEQIFKIVKGFGHSIVLFTEDGKKTVDPTEARRFYIKDLQTMINFEVNDSNSEIIINLSKDTDIDEIKPLIASLRNLANRYIVEFTVKTYGQSISPKDFAYQAKTIKETSMKIHDSWLALPDNNESWFGSSMFIAKRIYDELGAVKLSKKEIKQFLAKKGIKGIRYHVYVPPLDSVEDDHHRLLAGKPSANYVGDQAVKEADMDDSINEETISNFSNNLVKTLDKEMGLTYDHPRWGTIPANTFEVSAGSGKGTRNARSRGMLIKWPGATAAHQTGNDRTEIRKSARELIDNFLATLQPIKVKSRLFGDPDAAYKKGNTIILDQGEYLQVVTVSKLKNKNNFQTENESISEGFSGWHGSARKSMNELGDARLVVRHKRSVDETKRGARTRQIESIFVENADGERFKFPSKNLTAAKAMLRHVQEGGTPFDTFGQHIYECMAELDHLKKFNRKNKRNNFFEDESINEEIGMRIESIRKNLKQMAGPKGYKAHFESFVKEQNDVAPEKLEELKDNVTVRYFDESIADSLPYVAKVIEGMRTRKAKEAEIMDFAKFVMDNKDNISVSAPIDGADPENPVNRQFKDPATKISALVSYLAPKIQNDELANKMMQMSDTVFEVGPQHVKMALAALNVIRQRAQVAEASVDGGEKVAIDEQEIATINETFDKYNVQKIFGV